MIENILDVFNERLPHKPYYANDFSFGLRIASKETAVLAKYIQYNQPHAQFWLGFDVDRLGAAMDWSDRHAPPPNFAIMNPENGHAHLLYGLKTAIRTAPDGRIKPLQYAAAVENALRRKLDADVGYSGLVCKNPNHTQWRVSTWALELYTLDHLADYLDLAAQLKNDQQIQPDYGLGRNCTLFEKTRKWSYRAIRQGWPAYEQWLNACYERAKAYNLQFENPLNENEVQGIAKSIAKWTHGRFTQESFEEYVVRTHTPEIQSARGKKSKGGGRPSLGNPWEALGTSRRTYFRKKKCTTP